MLLYRAMSREEYNILIEKGFEATFRKRWKYFTLDPEYIYIIFHEPNYGLCPKIKYHVAVEFNILFSKPLEWLLRNDVIRVFRERKKYTTIAMKNIAPYHIEKLEYRVVDPDKLPEPEPVLIWINKHGKIRKVYRRDKALTILNQIKNPERILYISGETLWQWKK